MIQSSSSLPLFPIGLHSPNSDDPLALMETKMLWSPHPDSHTFTSLRPAFQSSVAFEIVPCNFPALRLLSSFV